MADTFPFFHAFADFYTRLKMFYNGFAVLFLVLSGKSNNYWVMGIGFRVSGIGSTVLGGEIVLEPVHFIIGLELS